MQTPEDRLTNLERSNRRWRHAAMAAWCALAACALVGQAQPDQQTLNAASITARDLVVQQKDSKFRIHLSATNDEARLELQGERNEQGISMVVNAKGSAIKMFASPASDHMIILNAPTDANDPFITLTDPAKPDFESTLRPGRADFRGKGKSAVHLGVDVGMPFVDLVDATGKTIWKH